MSTRSDRPSVFADRMYQILTALLAAELIGWGVQQWTGHAWPRGLNWALLEAIVVPAALLARRANKHAAVAPVARRYWRTVKLGISVFTVVFALRFAADFVHTTWIIPLSIGLHVVAGVLLTLPIVGLPFDRGHRRRLALRLDLGTLLAGLGLQIWHYAAGPAWRAGSVAGAAVIMAAGLNGVYLAGKAVLTGADSFTRRALALIGSSSLIGGLGSAICFFAPLHTVASPLLLVLPLAAYAAATGARVQIVDSTGGAPDRAARGFSLMPYIAVAAVDALVVATSIHEHGDHLLIDLVAVALTVLVLGRQLVAFRANDALLGRIGRQEERFRLLVQNSTDIVTITDPDGVVRYISPAVHRVLGLDPDRMLGHNIIHRMHPDDRATVAANVAAVVARPGHSATYRSRLRHADGSWRHLEIISANLLDEPSVRGIVTNSRDITETTQVQERLSHEASHDALTGLANRVLFADRVAAAVRRPTDARFSVVLVDLDDFKTVNDTLGHAAGDALLVHVADRMRATVRPTDTVARLGGDEFAILFDGLAAESIDGVLTRIADTLLEPAYLDGHLLSVQASFGVVDGHGGNDAGELMRQADIAMYEAKERGEGGHLRYADGMEARGAERSRLTAALRTALAEDQMVLHYQPVVTLPDGRMTGVEALVRWAHPERGLLGPGAFIDTAEQSGLVVPLGRWVLREAVRQAAAWVDELGDAAPGTVSVNASARQLREPGFAAEVTDALAAAGLPAHRLTIELTESTAIGGGATTETLRSLRAMGVRLSLDDFGTGASTLSLLATCPVDQIKLDRSFTPIPGPDAIATAVIQMATAFGIEAVAEGVETPEQAERLRRLGYTRAQGYLFAKPLPPAEISRRAARPVVRT
jgi:diguanylate cyclase (GGDEF)-like protein/PAS domain S-box-containing protein